VNPQTIVGMVLSIFGMGSSMVNEGVMVHRQLNPPYQQQAQTQLQQQCPPPKYKLEVVLTPNGQRQLICVEQAP
jgi:hypothetical protein